MPFNDPIVLPDIPGAALPDNVYSLVLTAILDGRLAPGERVRDVELAHRLGISRTPVREALQRLQRQGLLEVSAHRYTRVAPMDETTQREAIEYIGYLSGTLMHLGLLSMSEGDHARLLVLLDELVESARRSECDEVLMGSMLFYEGLTRALSNRMFHTLMQDTGVTARRFLAGWQPHPDDPELRAESYRQLREAFAARDADAAERIVRSQHGLV